MLRIDRSSIVLAIVLLCQIASIQFAIDAFAVTSQSAIGTAPKNEPSQLCMVGGSLPVLLEGKRTEPEAKTKPAERSFHEVKVQYCYLSTSAKQFSHHTDSPDLPIRRGYWLIYCALLL